MEIDKSTTKASSHSLKNKTIDASDDISMSELELLANKKKLNKKSDEIYIDNGDNNDNKTKDSNISIKKMSEKKSSKKKSVSDSDSSSKSSSSSTSQDKRERRKAYKENKSESTRREKNELLFKLYTIIEKSNGRWSTKLTIDNSLDEIRSEFTRIKAVLDNEAMVKFCKHGLVMGIKGVELLNNVYDPIGVDLDGWGEAMSYNMATTEYDEVLSELCEKYKGTGSMSPEVKLLLMIVMSGAMFSFSKKAAKDPSTLTNLMNSFMSKKSTPSPPPPSSPPRHFERPRPTPPPPPSPQPQQEFQQQFQSQFQMPQGPLGTFAQVQSARSVPTLEQLHRSGDIDSDDSDNIPSKIRGPSFSTPDSVNIENIIKTMKEKKTQKDEKPIDVKIRPDIEQILNETETSDEIVRNVPPPKKGKGRPRKTKAAGRAV